MQKAMNNKRSEYFQNIEKLRKMERENNAFINPGNTIYIEDLFKTGQDGGSS